MKGPRTYTGQDTVEFSLHGGPVVVRLALVACMTAGARQAGPGEFTFRAFMNGKLDLSRAEAVCDLISAKTEAAATASVRVLEGALSEKVSAWRERLLSVLMRLETAIDHAGDDFEPITQTELEAECAGLRGGLAGLLKNYAKARHLREGINAVICGRPNTGKSSLMNALLQRDRAIVSAIPGTTRDTIEETLDIAGMPVMITDTAGLRGASSDPIEAIGHERARNALSKADTVLWVLDGSQPLNDDDRAIERLLAAQGLFTKTILIINKADLPQKLEEPAMPGVRAVVRISCLQGLGLEPLEESIVQCAGDAAAGPELIFVNERHCAALTGADRAIAEAQAALATASADILAFHIREALDCLGEITGDTADEEILSKIFSNFCIGK